MTTVHIQLFNAPECLLASHSVDVTDISETDAAVTSALIKLLRNSWTLAPGDTIKITEDDQ